MIADDKLFGCPFCGFRIKPGEEACNRCGGKFDSDTKFECPFCGDLVGSGMEACPTCHINFAEFQIRVKKIAKVESVDTLLMDLIRLEASNIEKEGKKFSCPQCDLMLDGSEETCPRCKADLTEGAAFQCPTCGEFVDPEAVTCSVCGASFERTGATSEEEQDAADHKAVSSALDDILTSAGHTGPLPEIEPRPELAEPVQEPPQPEKETNPEPTPEPVPEPSPEPAIEPVPEPAQQPEPMPEPEPYPTPAPTPVQAAPKKTRQRKLKAKP